MASKIQNLELPGEEAHFKMSPLVRIAQLKSVKLSERDPRIAAVMALCYPSENNLATLLLILRKTYQGVHSNQVGFPGGKAEVFDKDLLATAFRETHEEVGVESHSVTVVKSLSQVYIHPSNFIVQPFLGFSDHKPQFIIQESEVEKLIEVPVSMLLDPSNVVSEIMHTSYAENIEVPTYNLSGYSVWGATAMMLSEIKELVIKAM